MTTLSSSRRLSPSPRRGVTWSVLRLHRASLWCWAAFVLIGAVVLVRLHAMGTDARAASTCGGARGEFCDGAFPGSAPHSYALLDHFSGIAIAWLPFAVAVYAAGVLIGRELENGTAGLFWSQSVSPARWLAAKLAVPALLIVGGTAVLTLLFRWAWLSSPDGFAWSYGRYFHASGPVGPAYVLLGLALGVLAAFLRRRALPAMGIAFLGMLVAYNVGNHYRSRLWPASEWTGLQPPMSVSRSQQLEWGMVLNSGARVNDSPCFGRDDELSRCLAAHDATEVYARFHPASHYWPLQFVETGIVLVLAAAAVAASFWLLRRRLP
jgi:hypothetical protein